MSDTAANEQSTVIDDDVVVTDAQLDADFDADDDDTRDTGAADNGILTLGDDDADDKAGAGAEDANGFPDPATVAAEAKAKADAEAAKAGKPAVAAKTETTAEEKAARQQAASAAAAASSKQFIESMVSKIKDVEIGDGGTEVSPMPKTFGEFAEQFPEIAAVTQTMISHLRDELLSQMQPIQKMIQTQEITSAQQALADELASDVYGHPDAGEIIGSEAFEAWAAKQTPAFQRFIDAAATAQDAAPIIAKFKADTGTATRNRTPAQALADKQRAARDAKNKLHSATTRTRKSVPSTAGHGTSAEDLDRAFNEDDEGEE